MEIELAGELAVGFAEARPDDHRVVAAVRLPPLRSLGDVGVGHRGARRGLALQHYAIREPPERRFQDAVGSALAADVARDEAERVECFADRALERRRIVAVS